MSNALGYAQWIIPAGPSASNHEHVADQRICNARLALMPSFHEQHRQKIQIGLLERMTLKADAML